MKKLFDLKRIFAPYKVSVWNYADVTKDHYFWSWKSVLNFVKTIPVGDSGVSVYHGANRIVCHRRIL